MISTRSAKQKYTASAMTVGTSFAQTAPGVMVNSALVGFVLSSCECVLTYK